MKAHPDYFKLTCEEKALICNGCGPGGWKGVLVPDNILGADITESCDRHDHRYWLGGTEEDRLVADLEFIENVLEQIERAKGELLLTITRRELALGYYCAVRDHGHEYFAFQQKAA